MLAAEVLFQHGVIAGDEGVALIVTRSNGTGGDVVGVVADFVVEQIFAGFGPEGFQFVLSESRAGRGDRLVEHERRHRAAEAMAWPAQMSRF